MRNKHVSWHPYTPFKKQQESSSCSHLLEDLTQEGEGTSVGADSRWADMVT
jgi:hypothetical protein